MTSKRTIIMFFAAIVVLLFGASGVLADGPHGTDFNVEVPDRYGYKRADLHDGAIVEYIGDYNESFGASGSGVFDPFVRLQGGKDIPQKGYNTDANKPEFDTKSGKWTHAILLSEIPIIEFEYDEDMFGLFWEFWADINDSDSTPLISLDDFELYLTKYPELLGYEFSPEDAELIYDYADANSGHYILINDVNQGSGRGDLRYLVPADDSVAENCNYGNPLCETYLVLYSEWGGLKGDYLFDGGFEEWKVKIYPKLQVSKNIEGAYDVPVRWTITKDFDGEYHLFAGESVTHDYEVSVDPISDPPENAAVSGTITIVGDEDEDVLATITDKFNGADATITGCSVEPVNGEYPIAAGATVTCEYSLFLGGGPIDGTNVARASFEVDGVSLAFQGSADILAGEYVETLTGDPDITVDDDNLEGEDWSASAASETWTYTRDFDCSADPDEYTGGTYSYSHDNTATITQTGQSDDATVDVYCYAPVVSKTVETYFNRDWDWTITKDYDGDYDLFAGEKVTHQYLVSVDPTYTDNYWGVKGDITIVHSHPSRNMTLQDVSDLADGIPANVNCASFVVPFGGSLVCDYDTGGQDSPDENPFDGYNVATAVFADANWTGQEEIVFSADPTTEDEPVITVDDDNLEGEEWNADRAYEEWPYTKDFSCPTDTSLYTDGVLVFDDHINTAIINETEQTDTATVKLTCYALTVEKDAATSYDLTYEWYIIKDVDNPGPISVIGGESVVVNYTVEVGLVGDPVADNFFAWGDVFITNPHPTRDAELTSVTDVISSHGPADSFNCSLTVPASSALTCDYSSSLDDGTIRTNTATATQQLYNFVFDGSQTTVTTDGTKAYQGTTTIDFSDTADPAPVITHIDEEIDVYDLTLNMFLGTANALNDTLPMTFGPYPRTITAPDAFCGEFTVDNEAWFITNDTGATDSAFAYVDIEVPCEGCTPGFWQGGAGAPLWDEVNDTDWTGADTNPFIHTTLFNDFFNATEWPLEAGSPDTTSDLDGLTMYDLVSSGGTSDSARRAARDMVAAYLNETAFPATFPADTGDGLAYLRTEWFNAVEIGTDAAFDGFHNLVSGWNDPPDPGYCPLP
jgi:hypothetical protein